MLRRFRINVGRILFVMAWLAIWLTSWKYGEALVSMAGMGAVPSEAGQYLFVYLIVTPPSAVVGALAGRHILGVLCGLAGATGLVLWLMVFEG